MKRNVFVTKDLKNKLGDHYNVQTMDTNVDVFVNINEIYRYWLYLSELEIIRLILKYPGVFLYNHGSQLFLQLDCPN